ncbi:Lateral organ boundary [Sesbania bispinosa]|nr:Lateral organ boundary [Sesbania bispinosa]
MNRQNIGPPHACPLCRRQRRRSGCDGNCEFGRYFPANRVEEFENAFRLFGVNNMLRILRTVEPQQRQAAADSIMIEGTAWRNNPPHGILGHELELRSQIRSSFRELQSVNQLLSFFRNQATGGPNPNMQMGNTSQPVGVATQLSTLAAGTPAGGGMDPIKPNRPETFLERGESSTVASKENVKEKGKEIVVEENESEADE